MSCSVGVSTNQGQGSTRLVVFANARMIWADIKRRLEFKVALWLFVVFAVAVAVMSLFCR